jgi:hypothetical protein
MISLAAERGGEKRRQRRRVTVAQLSQVISGESYRSIPTDSPF